ncbi:MAG: extracellular solute-binding protein [Aromatoleum sp.]|jgi:multiple sugar transport system substrate-binding protein|uniref:ABC transporter substrate-binding protein n=1 Tax=Aromatoleum sp. TaxID=2307007 RepID=UPI002894FF67|nr:extracellular solute-binding protein [Aromatoleum sp.]MDT3668842.1 extracellular solute-binding protein [Aromatoleum sp.]
MHFNVLRSLGLLVSLASTVVTAPACAGAQADRAVAAVRQLIESGVVPAGTTLRLGFKQGNIDAFLGRDLALQKEWESRTGIVLDAHIVPQQATRKTLKSWERVDLTVARNHEYPDLFGEGLINDLTPLYAKFGFQLDGESADGFIRPDIQSWLGNRIVAVPADGDVAVLYLRRDLLDDPHEQEAFRKTYGRALEAPRTWREYEALQEFFHRPAQGLYGSAEERDEEGAWMYWSLRFLSATQGAPKLFDRGMRPQLESAAAIAATESYVAAVRYSPPGITDPGKGYNFVLPLFAQGKAFANLSTIAAARLFNDERSAVRGRFVAVPVPGDLHNGKLVRRNTIIYGNNLVIPASAPHPALAFLYAMWLTDPDVSLRSVGLSSGFADPYRWSHLHDPRVRDAYTPEALAVFADAWSAVCPPGTGLRGDSEYLAALDRHLTSAARGEIGAAEAMKRTTSDWNAITQRLGRATQARDRRALRASAGGGR